MRISFHATIHPLDLSSEFHSGENRLLGKVSLQFGEIRFGAKLSKVFLPDFSARISRSGSFARLCEDVAGGIIRDRFPEFRTEGTMDKINGKWRERGTRILARA